MIKVFVAKNSSLVDLTIHEFETERAANIFATLWRNMGYFVNIPA